MESITSLVSHRLIASNDNDKFEALKSYQNETIEESTVIRCRKLAFLSAFNLIKECLYLLRPQINFDQNLNNFFRSRKFMFHLRTTSDNLHNCEKYLNISSLNLNEIWFFLEFKIPFRCWNKINIKISSKNLTRYKLSNYDNPTRIDYATDINLLARHNRWIAKHNRKALQSVKNHH